MDNYSALEYFYIACAVIGGVVFLFRLAMLFLGGGDGGIDIDVPGDAGGFGNVESDFNILSMQSLSAFFMMFGLAGLALLRAGVHEIVSLVVAIASGVFTIWVVSQIFIQMKRLQSDGTLKNENAIGQEGTVYLTIPQNGTGQVRVSVQGGLRIFDAVSVDHQPISTGASIRVIKLISGKVLVVEKL